jgi:hypothetical protein
MALSYSFHIGSKKHAITSLKKLESVSKHNLRKFQSKIFDGSKNELLIGSDDLVKDTKTFYNNFFKNALDEYNKKQKRSDRKIKNYFNHVCDDVQKHIAVECIIQVGGYDFWEDKNLDERKKMTPIFKKQIEKLQKELPNFKIINAVIHYDEACPHVQLVGVPIKENCKRGLAVQVSKTSNFNKESLEVLQAKMREDIEKQMQDIYGKEIDLKPKEKGRNQDLARETYIKQQELEKLQEEIDDLKGAKSLIDSDITDLLIYKDKLNENIKQKENKEKEIDENIKQKKKVLSSTIPEDTIYNNIIKIKNLKNEDYIGKVGILNNKQSFYKASDIDDFLNTIQENSVNLYNQKQKIKEQEQAIKDKEDEIFKLKDDNRILDILQNDTIFKNLITQARKLFEDNVYYYAAELFTKMLKENGFIKEDTSKLRNKNRDRDDDWERE